MLLLSFPVLLSAQHVSYQCSSCAEWNAPQKPFQIYGNTYYVGPHGLSSILITSSAGDVLIDGGLPQSVSLITANIRSLGFRVEDVKLIANSHVHFDHAGGIRELQRLTGARVVASQWSAAVMTKNGLGRDDPQYGVIPPIPLLVHVETLSDGETFRVGDILITAHLTPGHTPGGTSWTWQSCEGSRCLYLVFADSLSPVSAGGFKFTKSREYPNAIQDFEKSYAFLRNTPCDILLTTHPDASSFWERIKARNNGVKPDRTIDTAACRWLAGSAEASLQKRIAEESAK
jgi:metallo-beta-lactamase class B